MLLLGAAEEMAAAARMPSAAVEGLGQARRWREQAAVLLPAVAAH